MLLLILFALWVLLAGEVTPMVCVTGALVAAVLTAFAGRLLD